VLLWHQNTWTVSHTWKSICDHTIPNASDLHDEKMWVVDVETNGAEQILNPCVVRVDPIYEILVPTSNHHLGEEEQNNNSQCSHSSVQFMSNLHIGVGCSIRRVSVWWIHLSGDGDLVVGFKPKRTMALVGVVKGNGHRGLGYASLSVFVDQVLEV